MFVYIHHNWVSQEWYLVLSVDANIVRHSSVSSLFSKRAPAAEFGVGKLEVGALLLPRRHLFRSLGVFQGSLGPARLLGLLGLALKKRLWGGACPGREPGLRQTPTKVLEAADLERGSES